MALICAANLAAQTEVTGDQCLLIEEDAHWSTTTVGGVRHIRGERTDRDLVRLAVLLLSLL